MPGAFSNWGVNGHGVTRKRRPGYGEVSSEPGSSLGRDVVIRDNCTPGGALRVVAGNSGAVSGTVRDQSGAVIPNAALVLTNTATNVVVNTVTNGVGFYIFPSVVPGAYTLSAQSAGMQKFEGAFTIRVAERIVIDPALTPGATATAVEVKDITPLVA